jgi:hypothetical protein
MQRLVQAVHLRLAAGEMRGRTVGQARQHRRALRHRPGQGIAYGGEQRLPCGFGRGQRVEAACLQAA